MTEVSQEQIAKVEAEVKARQAEELKRISEEKAREIEDKIRKEMAEKSEKEALAKKLADLEEQSKKQLAELEAKAKAEKEAFEKRLAELESQKRGISRNDSPFDSQKSNENIRVIDGIEVDVSKLDHAKIEEMSRKAWMEYTGIKDPTWGTPL